VRRALLLFAVAACGRFGFGDQPHISDGKRSDGGGSGIGDGPTVDAQPQPFAPNWKSGSRMRARLLEVGDGGDPIFYGWRDTATNTDCQSAIASDGFEHCMPVHARTDQFFADSSCTMPLAWTHGLCGHDSYGFFITGVQYHALPLTTPFAGQAYGMNGGACNTFATPSTGQLWNTGAEEPPSTFVQTHYFQRAVGTYTHVFYDWNDGSEFDLGAISFPSASCAPSGGEVSGTTGCRPTGEPVLVPVYSDSACTQRAYYDANDSSGVGEFITDVVSMCSTPFRVFQSNGQLGGSNYWTLDGNGCNAQSIGTGSLWNAFSVDPYPYGTISPSVRRGRIGYLQWTTSDGVSIPLAEWDQDLGRSCRPFIAADGVVRCLPRLPKVVNATTDATCSVPLTVAGNCYGVAPVDGVTYPTCDDGPYDVKNFAPLSAAYVQEEQTCTSLGPAYNTTVDTGSIPASTFAALTEVIE
jgi:hypothetical protein